MQAKTEDPRHKITPNAFQVAPVLLGLKLAGPGRRLSALLIDLVLVAIIANGWKLLFVPSAMGAPDWAGNVLFAIVATAFGVFLWRRRGRVPEDDPLLGNAGPEGAAAASGRRRAAKVALGCMGIFFVAVAVGGIWLATVADDPMTFPLEIEGETRNVTFRPAEIPTLVKELEALEAAEGDSAAAVAAARAARRLEGVGMQPDEIRDVVRDAFGSQAEAEVALEAVERALGGAPADQPEPRADADSVAAAPPPIDSLLTAYRQARASGDTAAERESGARLSRAVTGSDVPELESELGRLERRLDETEDELDEAEDELDEAEDRVEEAEERAANPGIMAIMTTVANDLGIGFGWSALYFTVFVVMWRGRTPGKRLLGMRVVSLDATPIGYWRSFERFGGYLAGLATGLLGFAQILWDPNRQGIHDKIAQTAVIRDPPVRDGP